jgi:eukaryotic-like serine/threonine-protein kinase
LPTIGDSLEGKYTLEDLIGTGGMGTVWRARHERLGRSCAVKFLSPVDSSKQELRVQRFIREAQLAASVQHSNVVGIFDFGELPTGELYMVMELLSGRSLGARLEHGPSLSIARLCDLLAQSLSGLGAIHEKGIVHRDLKPENLFLVDTGPELVVKVLDFGISRSLSSSGLSSLRTGPGFTMGTPRFMSPEQVRGAERLDGRSDLYALGVILYRATTGKYPFDETDLQRIFVRTVTEDPISPVKIRPEMGRHLSEVIDRALARNPQERFVSASEFRAALSATIDTLPPGLMSLWDEPGARTEPEGVVPFDISRGSLRFSSSQFFRLRWRRLLPLAVVAIVGLLAVMLLAR